MKYEELEKFNVKNKERFSKTSDNIMHRFTFVRKPSKIDNYATIKVGISTDKDTKTFQYLTMQGFSPVRFNYIFGNIVDASYDVYVLEIVDKIVKGEIYMTNISHLKDSNVLASV